MKIFSEVFFAKSFGIVLWGGANSKWKTSWRLHNELFSRTMLYEFMVINAQHTTYTYVQYFAYLRVKFVRIVCSESRKIEIMSLSAWLLLEAKLIFF